MNKRKVGFLLVSLIVVVLALYFIASTYARYTTELTAKTDVQVAKWNVNWKDGGKDEKEITLKVGESDPNKDNVVNGKIAPGLKLSDELEIDLAGTETAVEVYAKLGDDAQSKIQTALGDQYETLKDKFTLKVAVDKSSSDTDYADVSGDGSESSPLTIPLPGESGAKTAFVEGKSVKVTVTLEWTNDSDGHSEADTKVGENAPKIEDLPVTLVVKQKLAE